MKLDRMAVDKEDEESRVTPVKAFACKLQGRKYPHGNSQSRTWLNKYYRVDLYGLRAIHRD